MMAIHISLAIFLFFTAQAEASPRFPYAARTRDYSGWTPATQADTNTTGMAGATVALPSSISAAESNPAGFAMQTGSVSAQINRISITDRRIQPDGQSIDSSQWGLGVSPPPWGFAFTYYSPITENTTYVSPVTGHSLLTEVSLKEFRATVSRVFFDGKLALGISPGIVKAVRELGEYEYNSTAFSYRLGALFQLPNHFVLGAGYAPPLKIGPRSGGRDQNELPGFNRAVLRPSMTEFGAGWVPNRFFKVGAQLSYVGSTENTGLLADETVGTGSSATWTPRVGASYVLAEFRNFKAEWAVGSYYETSRLQWASNRLHGTTALEANPYFINLGVGFDLSNGYRNVMIGIGLDLVRTLRTFEIIPKDPTPPYQGFLPRMDLVSADGLPPIMTQGEERAAPATSVEDVGSMIKDVPGNITDKLSGRPTTVEKKEAADARTKQDGKRKRKKGQNSGNTQLSP